MLAAFRRGLVDRLVALGAGHMVGGWLPIVWRQWRRCQDCGWQWCIRGVRKVRTAVPTATSIAKASPTQVTLILLTPLATFVAKQRPKNDHPEPNCCVYCIQYTVYRIHYTLYTIHYTLYTIHYKIDRRMKRKVKKALD